MIINLLVFFFNFIHCSFHVRIDFGENPNPESMSGSSETPLLLLLYKILFNKHETDDSAILPEICEFFFDFSEGVENFSDLSENIRENPKDSEFIKQLKILIRSFDDSEKKQFFALKNLICNLFSDYIKDLKEGKKAFTDLKEIFNQLSEEDKSIFTKHAFELFGKKIVQETSNCVIS